jgi:WbqC-like protein
MTTAHRPRRLVLTAHQPSYIPWLGLLAKIASADLFCLFDGVPMEGSGFENRQRIKTAQGAQWLTVPVRRHIDTPIKDVMIANDQPWQRKHWRSIELAYQRAPFFNDYAEGVRAVISEPWERLVDLDAAMLAGFLHIFKIATPVVRASSYRFEGVKSSLVLDMSIHLGATEYVFGEKGRDYADVPAFERCGISVRFQHYKHPTYPQLHGPFVPNMGALDLLFNVGAEEGRRLILGAA